MVIEFLADGFEETEALCPLDMLRRAGITTVTAAVGQRSPDDLVVTGAHGISVIADTAACNLDYDGLKPEMILLPGGMPGADNLDNDETVDFFVKKAAGDGAYIAAICAAPIIPGKRGLLDGKRAVCYPGYEKQLTGAVFTGARVEVDGNMITSCGMGASLEFAHALITLLKGEDMADRLMSAVLAK